MEGNKEKSELHTLPRRLLSAPQPGGRSAGARPAPQPGRAVGAAGAAWPPRGTRPPDPAGVPAPGLQRAGCHAPAHPPAPAKGFAASSGAGPVSGVGVERTGHHGGVRSGLAMRGGRRVPQQMVAC